MKKRTITQKSSFGLFGNLIGKLMLVVMLFAFSVSVKATSFPFPQNYKYPGCIMPANANTTTIQSLYAEWKATYYVEGTMTGGANSGKAAARIKFLQPGDDGSATVSEGIGYGMLLMVYMDNTSNNTQGSFDKLWTYYQGNLDANNLMNWETTGFTGTASLTGAATDADIDVCQALIMADKQWGSTGTVDYMSAAQTLMHSIYQHEMNNAANGISNQVCPGDQFAKWTNPSYFITNAIELFKNVGTSGDAWATVLSNTYTLISTVSGLNTTGLIPDWCNYTGGLISSGSALGDCCSSQSTADAAGVGCSKFESYFMYDAIRVPWRMSQAFAWYGNTTAQAVSNKIAAWVSTSMSNDPSTAWDGYYLNGTSLSGKIESPFNSKGTYHNACFTGGLGISAMVGTNQILMNNTWTSASIDQGANGAYFTCTTQLLYLLCMSGNMPNFSNMNPAPVAAFNNATGGCSMVYVQFNKPMNSTSVTASTAGWTVTKDNANTPIKITVNSATLGTDGKTIALALAGATDEPFIQVAYSGTPTLSSADGKVVAAFSKDSVKDVLSCARPYAIAAATDIYADTIKVVFSKAMLASSYTLADFKITVKGTNVTITKITSSATDPTLVELLIAPGTVTASTDAITVNYTGTSLKSQDGGTPKAFTAVMSVINNYLVQTCNVIEAFSPVVSLTWSPYNGTMSQTKADPVVAGQIVGFYTKATAQQWDAVGGALTTGSWNTTMATNPFFKMRVYVSKAGAIIRVRLKNKAISADGTSATAIASSVTIPTANTWTNVTMDFTSQLPTAVTLNQIELAIEPDVALTTAESVYFDDIQLCPPPATTNFTRAYTSFDGSVLKVQFSSAMAIPTDFSGFVIKAGTLTNTITGVSLDPINKSTLVFAVSTPFVASDLITVSYSGTAAKGLNSLGVVAFTNLAAVNLTGRAIANGWRDDFNLDATTHPSESNTANIGGSTIYTKVETIATPGTYAVTAKAPFTTEYASFGPTVAAPASNEVWDITADPVVRFSVAVPTGQTAYIRADLVDLVNNRSTDAVSPILITGDGNQHSYAIDFTGKFINQYGSSPGVVDKTNIVAVNLYQWKIASPAADSPANAALTFSTATYTYDWISVGTTTAVYNTPVEGTKVTMGATTTATSSAVGTIYLVPGTNASYPATPRILQALLDSVKAGRGLAVAVATKDVAVTIPTTGLNAGYYIMYAVNTATGEVSRKSDGINIIDITPPIITQASNGNFAAGYPITVTVNKDAKVYIVPQGTAADLADIINASINSPQAVSKATTQIMTLPLLLTTGSKYVFYAIDYSGNISLVSTQVVTIVDVTPPIISNNTTGNVTVTTGTISAMSSKDGKLFLVKQSDIASIIDSTSLKSKAVVTKAAVANTLISFAATVALGDYVIYAIDGSGNIAGPTDVVSVVVGCVNINTLQASSPSLIIKVGDPSVKLTISIATPSNATSPDNTLTTFVADASSVVDITNNLDGSCSIVGDPSVLTTTKVNITCTVTDCGKNLVTIVIPVTVNPLITCPTAISIAPLTQSIQVGAIGTLTPTITGTIGTNNVNWTSASTNYVTMTGSTNTTGSANGIAVGSSVITASITCSGVTINATATVNVAKIPVTKIVVTPPSASVIIGYTTNLAVIVTPSNATDTTVTWTSSKPTVAKVSSSGVVSALSVGTVTITATSNDNGAIVSSAIITVTPIDVTSITLTPSVSTTMFVKDNLSIVTRVLPLTATDSTIIWTGNNDAVATVASGVVTAYQLGTVTITATSSENPSVKATLTIVVSNVDVKSIAIVGSTTMTVNGIQTLNANITPSNATDHSVTWSSSSSATASVNATSGLVTANASGTVTITATSVQNPTVTQTITIVVSKIMPATISLSPSTTQNINVKDFVKLTANILPIAADQSVQWSSSNDNIATVDVNGKVIGVSEGQVTITATSSSVGTLSASITVNVSLVHVQTIALSASSTTMTVGGTLPISVTLTPVSPTDPSLVWSVTNGTGSATVDQFGIVTASTAGSVTIVATSVQDNKVSGTYVITISDILPTALTLNYTTTQSINVNGTITLAPIFTPSNAANKKVTWSSDNAAATVDTNGVVTGISEGTANITATSKAVGTISASVKVIVSLVHVGSISVTSSLPTMTVNGTLGMTATLTPTSPTDKSIIWSVINGTGTATVDASGVVTALTAGTVTVVATSVQDPKVSGSFIITISNILASKIVLSPATTINLNVGNTVQVTANVTPTNAYDKTVQWKSSNNLVATVDVDGNVLAIGPGSAYIIATSSTVSTVKDSVPVSVTNLLISSIAVTPLTYSFIVGQVSQLSATITPSNATLKTYTWKSNDPSIVTIDANGVITAKAVGTVTITATANDAGAKVGTSTITVNPVPPVSIAASDISLLMTDAGKTVSYTVSPDSTTDKSVSFKSNDQTIATVDASGLVVPTGVGNTTITITSKADGTVLTTIKVTVTSTVNVISSVTPSVPTLTIAPGVSQTILLTLNPLDASITSIDWKSSNTGAATVDANGVIKAIADGSSTITVTVTGPNASQTGTVTQTATISVTVASIPVSSIVLDNPNLNLTLASGTTQLTATILPITATNQNITWLSTDPSVATVNAYGVVSVVALGTTTITATTKDGTALTATSIVTVSNVPPKSITIDSTSVLLNVNDIVKLTATVLPANASQSVVWSILDPTIASIDAASGKVTAIKAGSTKITATSQIDNTITQTIDLQVQTVPVTKIVLDQTQLALNLLSPSVTLKATLSPSNPTINTVKWDVNPTGVINISGGTISVLALGTTTVICTANDGSGVTATCLVTVSNIAPASILIAPTSVTMNIGDLPNVASTVLPNGAPQGVTWSTADPSIATIDNKGMITGHSDGKTSIIATSTDGSVTTSIPLTVHKVLVTTIVIDQPKVSLNVGSNATLNVTFTPTNATDQSVTWSVLPANIVDVNKGVIHANAVGTATVTCTANDGSGIFATCAVTVSNIPPASITLDQTPIALTVGGSQTLSATVLPTGAPSGLTWISSDTTIATVDASGNVVAHKAGSAIITVTSQADATIHNSVSVVVTKIPVTAISVDSPKVTLQIKTSVQVNPIITPSTATNTNVTWLSADNSIASVSTNGVITANGVGTTTITVTSSDNTSISSPIQVIVTKIPVASITVDKTDVTVNDKGSTVLVTATILPTDANTAVVWTSAEPTLATVVGGLIKGVATGSTTVTAASADDPTIFKIINVTITHVVTNIPVTSVSMDKPVLNLEVGQTGQLNASVIPANASNTTITYTSNSAAFSVDPQSGLVTAVSVATGGLVIATSADGGFTATCTVNVSAVSLKGIVFSSSSVDCPATGTVDLSSSSLISFQPSGIATPILNWTLSDPSLGSITTNGVFTPSATSGTETVTVTSGLITATIQVNITTTAVPVSTVTVSSAVSTVKFNQTTTSGVLQMKATIAPSNATEQGISWSLQKPMAGVSIDQNGLLTFTNIDGLSSNGTVTVVATSPDGGKNGTAPIQIVFNYIVTSDTISTAATTINQNSTLQMVGSTKPVVTLTNMPIVWSILSSTSTGASISSTGLLTAGSIDGTITVVATVTDANNNNTVFTSQRIITVHTVIDVTDITVNNGVSTMNLQKGDSPIIAVSYLPANTEQIGVTITSSNPNIVAVDNSTNGKIIAQNGGTATITITSAVNPLIKKTIIVTVDEKVSSINLSNSNATINVGDSTIITARVLSITATNQKLLYSLDKTNLAKITYGSTIDNSSTFVLKGVAAGTVTVTISANDSSNVSNTISVTIVNVPVSSVKIGTSTSSDIEIGKSETLSASVAPNKATFQAVQWITSDSTILKVSSTGIITGVAIGSAKITVKSISDPSKFDTLTFTVISPILDTYTLDSLIDAGSTLYGTAHANPTKYNKTLADQLATYIMNGSTVSGEAQGSSTLTQADIDKAAADIQLAMDKLTGKVGFNNVEASIIVLYPNPVIDQLQVKGESILSITVIDMNGQTVITTPNTTIDFSGLAAGIYNVIVKTSTTVSIQSVVKQ